MSFHRLDSIQFLAVQHQAIAYPVEIGNDGFAAIATRIIESPRRLHQPAGAVVAAAGGFFTGSMSPAEAIQLAILSLMGIFARQAIAKQ